MAAMSNCASPNVVKIALKTDLKALKPSVEKVLSYHGPDGVLKVNINTNMTWLELLVNLNVLQGKVSEERKFVIKNDTGTVVSRVTDSIAEHIAKYKKSRDIYVARIMNKTTKATYKVPTMKNMSKPKKAKNASSGMSRPEPKSTNPKVHKKEIPVSVQQTHERSNRNEGVASSSAAQEEISRQPKDVPKINNVNSEDEIPIERVQSQAKLEKEAKDSSGDPKKCVLAILDRDVSNSVLWRMKKEFDEVNESGDWLDLVTPRIPRLGNLMASMFSDANFKNIT